MKWTCKICNTPDEPMQTGDMMEHFRLLHPEILGRALAVGGGGHSDFDRWPDGQLAVFDDTLTPDDFT